MDLQSPNSISVPAAASGWKATLVRHTDQNLGRWTPNMTDAFRAHWPECLIEAILLGVFMFSAFLVFACELFECDLAKSSLT